MADKGITVLQVLYGAIAVILLVCLFNMPYGYYTFVRFASAAAFCYFAYKDYQDGKKDRMILFIFLAVLFQPFVKIPLGRVVWNVVDVATAVFLLFCLFKKG